MRIKLLVANLAPDNNISEYWRHMSKRLHDTKLHKDFENKTKSKEEKREKQGLKNDLKRLNSNDADMDDYLVHEYD